MSGPLDDQPGGTATTERPFVPQARPDTLEILFRPDDRPQRPRPAADLEEPAGAHRVRRGTLRALLALVTGAAAAVVLLIRSDGVPPWRVLWAEDGTRFLMNAVTDPGRHSWPEPYAGYLHVLPRAIGSLAAQFPLRDAAAVFAVTSAALAAAALVAFATGLRRWLPRPWMQAGLVAALVLLHTTAGEIAGNVANLHWYLTLGLLGLALVRPARLVTALPLAALAAAFALSDPFVLLIAPLALFDAVWRTAARRGPLLASWPVPLAIAAGAGLQAWTMFAEPRPPSPWPEGLTAAATAEQYAFRVVQDGLSPQVLDPYPAETLGLALAGIGAALALVGLVVLATRRRIGGRAVAGVLLVAASPAVFAVCVWVNHGVAERYAAVPAMLLVTGLLVLLAGVPRVGPGLFALACVAIAVLGAASWTTHPLRSAGPDYVSDVRRAAVTQCPAPEFAARIRLAPAYPDAPGSERWHATLPCTRLLDGRVELPWR